jgi:hypothetical protein
MIDVLADLRSFAQQNGMRALSDQLDDTILVAAAELAQAAQGGRFGGNGGIASPLSGTVEAR